MFIVVTSMRKTYAKEKQNGGESDEGIIKSIKKNRNYTININCIINSICA